MNTVDTLPGSPDELRCDELVEMTTDYFEGALTAHDRLRFEEHLSSCSGCDAYVQQMHVVIAASGRLRADDVPEAFIVALRTAIEAGQAGTRPASDPSSGGGETR